MENEEIDLKEIINLFWEKRAIVFVAIIVATILGFIYTMYFKDPKYTASATLLLAQKDVGETSQAVTQTDITLNDKLIATYKELTKSNSIVREVINNLSLTNMTEGKLKSEINVTAVKDTQILRISVTDLEPSIAQMVANELSEVFVKKVSELYKIDNINIVDSAELPSSPSNINHKKDILIFIVAGIVLSVGIILVINLLDTTVKTQDDIEKALDLMILAEIPDCDFKDRK